MKLLLCIVINCLLLSTTNGDDQENAKTDEEHHAFVVNGHDADPHEWPWQVMLKRSGSFICGGSLISAEWVLSAAHCVNTNPDASIYTVEVGAHRRLGSTSVQKRLSVISLWYHTGFRSYHLRNDVALLLLNETVQISSKIKPIKLPREETKIQAGKTCYITGWGRLRGYGSLADVLQEAPLKIGNDSSCLNKNGQTYDNFTMVCAGSEGKGGCNGDSGGPLSCYEGGEWILRGVVSWGKWGCPASYYTVFARVSSFISWISMAKKQRGNLNCTFEDMQFCNGWIQDKSDNFEWTRKQGPTYTPGTGPSADHTKGSYSGYYMYIDTTYRKSGEKARLFSRLTNSTDESVCLSFWYHMYGRDIGTLNIHSKGGQQSATVWSRQGASGNRWLQGKVTLKTQNTTTIIIEGVVGNGREGNIAIDDIFVTKGLCTIAQSCRDQTCYNRGNAYCLNNKGYCYCQTGSYGKQCESLSYNCSFDGGLCPLWEQDTTEVLDWTRYQGSTPDYGTGPSSDHTGLGSYLYIETSSTHFGDTARLISKRFPATIHMCLSFWYHMYGRDVNTLRVLLKKGRQQLIVWSRKIQSGQDRWLEGKVTLKSDNPFQVVFEGVAGNSYYGDIAIDDVSFVNGTCKTSKSCRDQICYNDGHAYCLNDKGHCYCPDDSIGLHCEMYRCNFNKDFCPSLWYQDRADIFDWTRNRGSTPFSNTGPSADHIRKVDLSHEEYISVQTSCNYTYINKDSGRLTSPNYPGYYSNLQSCHWLLTSNRRIALSFESFSTRWCCDKVYVHDGESSSSRLIGRFSGSSLPSKLTSSSNQLYVRFTSGGYGRYRGFSAKYGPAGHIQANGYYIYIYTSYRRFGDTARFISKPLPATNETCLSFWYHMYGGDINTLKVIIKTNRENTTVWSRNGESGNRWLEGKVTIISSKTYQITFEGAAGSGVLGHIALDEISITKGACNISRSCRDQICHNDGNPYCLNNTGYCYCISGTYGEHCQFESDACTFEKGLCYLWTQDTKDAFDWTRKSGSIWPYTTGPSGDHTNGSGYYMYIQSRYRPIGSVAHLISRELRATNHTCLSFWYHMYGINIGTLRVLVKNGTQNVTTVWSRKGQSGNRWLQGKITLQSQDRFQVVFEGVSGGYYGDIAIDDVSFRNGNCNISKSCRDQFCHHGHPYCVNNTGYCYCAEDYFGKHCEHYKCTFDQGLCHSTWYQDRTDVFDWTRHRYSTPMSNTGPSADHTTGSGYYIYINTYYRRFGDTARFVSKPFPATNETCLSFWYHMYGDDINTLRVIVKSNHVNKSVWSRTSESGNRWLEGKVTIRSNETYQVVFEGITGHGVRGHIAIDDISFQKGTCNVSKSCRDQICYNNGHAYCLNNQGHCYCPDDSIGQHCERYRCNFNEDLCGSLWYQDRTDNFDWTRYRGQTPNLNTGPSGDHIEGGDAPDWAYISVQTSCKYSPINKYSGRLMSPNYPSYYGNRQKCYWLLTSGSTISLLFERFSTESCCDKVYVYDGGSTSAKLLGQFSGSSLPPKITSSSNQLYVQFNTDFSRTYSGFSAKYGPPGYLQEQGYFIYIYTEYRRFGDTARFLSKPLPATNSTCLSFWYHMYGGDINTLRVFVNSSVKNSSVWFRKGESGNRWLEGKVTIITNVTYQIAFDAAAGSGSEGQIALDDISINEGACNISRSCRDQICHNDGNPYCSKNTGSCHCVIGTYGEKCRFVSEHCTFDDGLCYLWNQDTKDAFDWIRRSGSIWPDTTGPSVDHTKGSGYYMYIQSRYRTIGSAAHLISRELPATNHTCLSFWYHMYGINIGALRVLVRNCTQNVTTVWSRNGQRGNRWLQGQVTLQSQDKFQVVFVGTSGGYYGDIAIDDVSLMNGTCNISESCRNQVCYNGGRPYCVNNTGYCYCTDDYFGKHCEFYRCTFDKHQCTSKWYQDRNDDYEWYRSRYAYPSNTGPSHDHTTGSGYFMYIYTSNRRFGDKARFISKPIPAINDICLSFWYHMYGRDVNTLRVMVKTSHGSIIVWSRKGESGNRWLEGKVNIVRNVSYQIIFEGVAGGGAYGQIAFDDVSMRNGTCNISKSCRDQVCYNGGNPYCFKNNGYCYCPTGTHGEYCQSVSHVCTFEKDLCYLWSQDNMDSFDWTRYRGSSWPYTTGPSVDHTSGSGYYIYIVSRYRTIGSTARLISRELPATNHTCLSFWYHMYGIDIGTLRVLMKKENDTIKTIIWSRRGEAGNRWLQGQVTIQADDRFQLFLEGISGGYYGNIAIDDVSIMEGNCNISKSCNDQNCYNNGHAYCLNNKGHCSCFDDSIGQHCEIYRCNFNKDLCSSLWYQDRTDIFDWTRYRYSTPVANTGPSEDHISKVDVSLAYISVQSNCKFTSINKHSGRLTSPNHGGYYGNLQSCYWLLTSNERISLIFESFSTELRYDYVYVYDGGSQSSRFIGQFSGSTLPPKLTSSSNQLYVRFTSDSSIVYRGFSAKYEPSRNLQANGYYIYIYISYRRFGDTARFISKSLPATNSTCLSFWYHMYGANINTLKVIVKTSRQNNIVWSRKGESGNRWLEGKVTIVSNYTYQIAFEGVAGNGALGHIALDEISISERLCNISRSCREQFCYNHGTPYCWNNEGYCYCHNQTYGEHCQYVSYSCTFENGLCSVWHQDHTDGYDWYRQRGSSWPYSTGPFADHTTGTSYGYYMFIRSRYRPVGSTARLISRQLPATKHTCLSFWYHMYGINIGTLRVLMKRENATTIIWSRKGQSGNRWLQGKLTLVSHHKFQVVIEATAGGYYGDIAIDDVFIVNRTCNMSSVSTTAKTYTEMTTSWPKQTTTKRPYTVTTTKKPYTTTRKPYTVTTTKKPSTAATTKKPSTAAATTKKPYTAATTKNPYITKTTERTYTSTTTTKKSTQDITTTKPCYSKISCYNGGSPWCNGVDGRMYCICGPGYTGRNCEYKYMNCPEIVCFNGGIRDCSEDRQAMCNCPPGYTGRQCQSKIMICPIINCFNGGTVACTSTGEAFCRCKTGYNGNFCQDVAEDDQENSLTCYHCNTTSCKSGERKCTEQDNKCAIITAGNSTSRTCVHQTMCDNYCNAKTNCTIQCCDKDLCNHNSRGLSVEPTLIIIFLSTIFIMITGGNLY